MAQSTENWMSSVSRWKGQPPFSRITWADTRKPVPDTWQLVPSRVRGKLRNRASRKNQMEYPAEIQLSPKFLELR